MAKTEHNIRLDFWKWYPARWLLSEKIQAMRQKGMEFVGAYRDLLCHAEQEPLPGVLLLDEERLIRLSGLKRKQWEKGRGVILAAFEFHPPTATLHAPLTKSLYLEMWEKLETSRRQGLQGAAKRYGKDGAKPPYSPPTASPYTSFQPPFLAISSRNLAQVLETSQKILISLAMDGVAVAPLYPGNSKQQHLSSSTQQGGDVPATPEAGDGTAADSQDSPQPPAGPVNFREIYRRGIQKTAGGAA